MDSKGQWHTEPDFFGQFVEGKPPRERPIISAAIGEIVRVCSADGVPASFSFDGADKNKVTLTPVGVPPYFDFASTVTMENVAGESCKAQVWDNRDGKLILRTLPL